MSSGIRQNSDYHYRLADGLPWHGTGIQEQDYMTRDDVIRFMPRFSEAPVTLPVYFRDPSNHAERNAKPCGNKRAIVWPSDGTYLGMASDQYRGKAYIDAFDRSFGWLAELGANISGAGLIDGGSRAFILARIPDLGFNVANDTHQMWLALFAGSDGQTGIYPMATTVRIVCQNTANAALGEAKANGRARSIAHHGNVDAKLAEASVALGQLAETRNAYQAACARLLDKAMGFKAEQDFVMELVAGDSTRARNTRESILHLAHHGAGNRPYAGTAYSLFQGVTDHVDHVAVQSSKGNVNERRFSYSMEGTGASMKAQAMTLLLEYEPTATTAAPIEPATSDPSDPLANLFSGTAGFAD